MAAAMSALLCGSTADIPVATASYPNKATKGFKDMSLAYYIVLNTENKDVDTLLSGKALGHSYKSIQEAAAELSVTPLGDRF